MPQLDTASWSLRVWGEVEQEVTIDWATLLKQPLEQHLVTLTCVSNEVGGDLVGNALWTGWPVRNLLAMAKPKAGADMVLSRSSDGFTAGTPIEALTDDRNAMIAVAMNGQALPFEHGFPARLVVPGLYGYVSATKWVTELKVTRFSADEGYWTPRGWSAKGPIKTASRIDVPRAGRGVKAGTVAVAGVAWAQHRGISKVEVQVDDGPWQQATLAAEPTVDAWRQWVLMWAATPGHARDPGARDRRDRGDADRPAGSARPGRRDRLAHRPGRRHVASGFVDWATRGSGGTGRHAGFRFLCLGVRVRVPPSAPVRGAPVGGHDSTCESARIGRIGRYCQTCLDVAAFRPGRPRSRAPAYPGLSRRTGRG